MTEDHDEQQHIDDTEHTAKPARRRRPLWILPAAILLIAILTVASFAGYVYAVSPPVIREPLMEHYHFRMQILVDGKAQDFSTATYQEGYSKDQCSAGLTDHPIHFHDKRDQLVHIHWEGMTGGLVMKYYGWNYLGGKDDSLGYRIDKGMLHPQAVPIHGDVLPAVPAGDNFYVYTGDANSYKQRNFNDWKNQDLEQFFGRTSTFPAHELNKQKTSLLDHIVPKAYAHAADDGNPQESSEASEEELKAINNLEGNVVIFVQKNKPTDQQVKERFDKLVPLEASTCGG